MGVKLRRIVSVSLILSLVFSSLGFVSAAASNSIKDYEGHWAQKQIEIWLDKGWLKGFEDGSIKPNHSITRAEFVALVNRFFEIKESNPVKFTDLPASGWVYEEFSKAVTQGYIKGYGDKVRPNDSVTRQEVAVIISKLLLLEDGNPIVLDQFKDREQIAAWSESKVAAMINAEYMKGYPSGNFAPTQALTRAEAVAVLESLNVLSGGPGDVSIPKPTVFGSNDPAHLMGHNNVTVSTYGVKLQNLIIYKDLLLDEGIGEGEVSLDNVTVKGKVIVKGGGVNSIHFKNSTIEQVVVQRKGGNVRLVTEGSTQIKSLVVQTGAILNLGQSTTVSKVILEALTKVTGQGRLLSVTVNDGAKGSSFEKKPDLVEGSQKDSISVPTPTTVTPTVGAVAGGSGGGGGGSVGGGGATSTPTTTPTPTPTPTPAVNIPVVNEITLVQDAVYKYTNAATITVNLSKVSHALSTQTDHAEYYFTKDLEVSLDMDKAQGFFPYDMFVTFPIEPDHIKDYMTIILIDEDGAPIGYKSIKLDLNAKYTTLDMSTVTKYSEGVNITGSSDSEYIENRISLTPAFVQQLPEVKYFTTTSNTEIPVILDPTKDFNVEHISSTIAYLNEVSTRYDVVEISHESYDYYGSPFYTQPNFEEEYMVILYDSELYVVGYYQGKANLTDQQKANNVGFKIRKLPAVDLLVLNDEAAVNWVYDRYMKLTDDQMNLVAGELVTKLLDLKAKLLLLKQN